MYCHYFGLPDLREFFPELMLVTNWPSSPKMLTEPVPYGLENPSAILGDILALLYSKDLIFGW